MPPSATRSQILSVGGNGVSSFLSWRLQASNSCDVTLVWKNGFDHVSRYGVSFKSEKYGKERFRPWNVVRTPDEGVQPNQPFDYIVFCVKALPELYDLASVIANVITPQHTCIIVNTTTALGIDSFLQKRFPENVVLSLISCLDITQTGISDFEHSGSSLMYLGSTGKPDSVPSTTQNDMASALATTLNSCDVDCRPTPNIRQLQFERMIGPAAFYPASVIFNCPNHAQLLEKFGTRQLISSVIDELISLAGELKCAFSDSFKDSVIEQMTSNAENINPMYRDFVARKPMEVETYLGAVVNFANEHQISVPRMETLYTILHNINTDNQTRPQHTPIPSPNPSTGRIASKSTTTLPRVRPPGPPIGAPRRGPASAQIAQRPPPHPLANGPGIMSGRSFTSENVSDLTNLDEFNHLFVDDEPESSRSSPADQRRPPELSLRERELGLRQRELKIKEQELEMMRWTKPRSRRMQHGHYYDYVDGDGRSSSSDHRARLSRPPILDPNFDMLSATNLRNRKRDPASQRKEIRKNPELMALSPLSASRPQSELPRYPPKRRNASEQIIEQMPGLHDDLLSDSIPACYSSNRYANVDSGELRQQESRANSLTSSQISSRHNIPPRAEPATVPPPMY